MSRLRRLVVLWLAAAMLPTWAVAQGGGTITGSVVDAASQRPLGGVQIFIVGTQRGTLTNQEGRFVLPNVPAGQQQVRASLIGFSQSTQTATVTAGQTSNVTFALSPSAIELSAVVVNAVTGQRQQQRELGNAVGNVDVAEMEMAPITRPADVLTGRVANVTVQTTGGTSGTGQKIRIRGANSLSLSNEPLIIIDGIRFENNTRIGDIEFSEGGIDQDPNRLNDLSPENIATIEVLKGPAASGIYGTAAANGVIVITTKQGIAGRPQWNFFAESGIIQESSKYPDNIVSLRRTATGAYSPCYLFQVGAGACVQDSIARFNPLENEETTPFQDGSRQKYGASVSGGSEAATYYLSGDFEDEQGIYANNTLEKINLRGNLRAGLRDDLSVTISSGYISSDAAFPANDNSIISPILNGLLGRARFDPAQMSRAYYLFSPTETDQYTYSQGISRFTGSANANYQPFSWLTANVTAGLDQVNNHDYQTLPPEVFPIAPEWTIGWIEEGRGTTSNYTLNGAANGQFQFSDAINSTTTVGFDYNEVIFRATRAFGAGVTPGTNSLDGTSSLFRVDEDNQSVITVGGFVQQQFGILDRIFVTGALRADDNSAFGEDFGLIYYPSAQVSWVVDEESFFPQTDLLSALRLRASYGRSGLRPNFRDAVTYFDPVAVASNAGDEPGITIGGTGNVDLKPEKTSELELGFDAGLFGDRLGVEFTYYNKVSEDALIERDLPPSLGLTLSRFENLGEVQNQGIELTLDARLLDTERFGWNVRGSFSTLDNEIVELGEGVEPIVLNRGNQLHKEGFPAGGFFQPKVTYEDRDGDNLIDLDEYAVGDSLSYIGPVLPTRLATLSSDVRLFDLLNVSAVFEGRWGNHQLNDNENFRCFFAAVSSDRGCAGAYDPNASLRDQAGFLSSVFGDPDSGATSYDLYIEDASFVRFRELAITLNPPSSLTRFLGDARGVSLTVAGRNLAIWTNYTGIDPEANETGSNSNFTQGEFGSQAPVRYWTARLNFSF